MELAFDLEPEKPVEELNWRQPKLIPIQYWIAYMELSYRPGTARKFPAGMKNTIWHSPGSRHKSVKKHDIPGLTIQEIIGKYGL